MGKHLFIRVSAHTFDEQKVQKAWPTLYEMAWPDVYKTPEKKAVETFAGKRNKGVLELVSAVHEAVVFGKCLDSKDAVTLSPILTKSMLLLQSLEEALASRDVPLAHKLTNEIEDTLDELEKTAKKIVRT